MERFRPKLKNSYTFSKKNYFISGRNLRSPENKNFLYFSEKKFSPYSRMTYDKAVK